jgi:hypothetical protein
MPYNPGMSSTPTNAGSHDARRDEQPSSPPSSPSRETVGWLSLPPMRFPNLYVWFVFFSALDIMLTWAILRRGGTEVNPVADAVIKNWGLPGAIVFKFSLTLLVVVVCEIVARQRYGTALGLAITAMLVSAVPVVYSLGLLLLHTLHSAQ